MNYRMVYCSRNRILGTQEEVHAEIDSILLASRRNNQAADLTGALLFNGNAFAQVLEGSRDAIDLAYARIRFDPRHSDVLVLEQAYQLGRYFPSWAMAYADARSFQSLAGAGFDLEAVFANPHGFASRILQLMRDVVNAHA